MKKIIFKTATIICAITLLLSTNPVVTKAEEGVIIEKDNPALYRALISMQSEPKLIDDGAISEEELASLKGHLTISGRLIDNIEGLQYAKNITGLDVSSNYITSIKPISELSQLEYLDLSNNSYSNVNPIRKLKNLTYLNISSNQLISSLKPLKGMKKLLELNIGDTGVTNIAMLKNMKNLTALDMGFTEVKNFKPLSKLKKLSRLNLEDTIIKNLKVLKPLTNLNELDISYTKVRNLKALTKASRLVFLKLDGLKKIKSFAPLKKLNYMQKLSINESRFSNLKVLKKMKNLLNLEINDARIKDLTPVKHLKELTSLSVNDNDIYDLSPIVYLNKLTSVNAVDNKISSVAPIPYKDFFFAYLNKNLLQAYGNEYGEKSKFLNYYCEGFVADAASQAKVEVKSYVVEGSKGNTITVPKGTNINAIKRTMVILSYNNNEKAVKIMDDIKVPVNWNSSNYKSDTPGTYDFTGTIDENYSPYPTELNNHSVSMKVVVDGSKTASSSNTFNKLKLLDGSKNYLKFDPDTTKYDVEIPGAAEMLTLETGLKRGIVSTVRVNGRVISRVSVNAYPIAPLEYGENKIEVVAMSETGDYKTYTINATRLEQSKDASIEKVILPTKAKIKGKTITAKVSSSILSMPVIVKTAPGASFDVYLDPEGHDYVSDSILTLKKGKNLAYIRVFSEDASTLETYKLRINVK